MGQIQLSGSVGAGGAFPVLGNENVEIVGNANLTLDLAEYSNNYLNVTSDGTSTGIRTVFLPLIAGNFYHVKNSTSEGFSINVGGATGALVQVPPGEIVHIVTDGTNYDLVGAARGAGAIIYRPGGVATGNVYTTSADVAAAIEAANGAINVYVDDSIVSPCVLDPGVIWDFKGFGAPYGSTPYYPELFISDTAQLRNLGQALTNIIITTASKTLPSIDYDDWTETPTIALIAAEWFIDSTATIPPVSIPGDGNLFLLLYAGSGTIVSAAPTVGLIKLETGAGVQVYVFGLAVVDPATFVGGAGTTLQYVGDPTAYPVPAWTLFTGTLTPQAPLGNATGVTYTPAVPGNWAGTAPATVQEALDRIAANTTNTHPIP